MNLQPLAQALRHAVPRGLALFFGMFSVGNFLLWLRAAHGDATVLWLDLRALPVWLVQPLLLISSLTFIAFGVRLPRSEWRRFLTAGCATVLSMVALFNAGNFYRLLFKGQFHTAWPVPFSLVIAAGLILIAHDALQPHWLTENRKAKLTPALVSGAVCAIIFPLALMLSFGLSDYRKSADVAVVFGARAYADGRPSDALADRIRTACQLYRSGEVRKLIMSGGPGDGVHHETEVMKRLAMEWGVPADNILIDEHGWNTQNTVRNTSPMLRSMGAKRVLVVSHFYHLPRIKLAYQHAGIEVRTVPAKEQRFLRQLPYNMARETVAFWSYYIRPRA